MNDERPPPSREHFEDFTRRLLRVPKEKVDKLVAEAHERRKRRRPAKGARNEDVVP